MIGQSDSLRKFVRSSQQGFVADKDDVDSSSSRLLADRHGIPGATGCPQPVPDGPRRFPTG